ncbi:MAG: double-strand break repair protein AddB, partial [Alphaproteobacteria bacterium]|nr:double-strand break repair protein AddB [Alphaproteobacteria bacterium]
MPHVYNIPLSCSLVDVLASHLLKKYADNLLELTDVTVLLPNRRAVRELRNAFIRLHGMNATLLPQILPLGNVDEDGFFFSGNDIDIPNAISPTERLMIFIRLITARPDDFKLEHLSFAQACYLARELASLVDMVNNEQLDFAKLQNLVPEEYAAHWQNTLDFLKIITAYFPQILQERGLIDIAEYNNLLLKQQNQIWQKNAPQKEIIIAGTTATFPAMKELVKTVAEMPNGSVWLSGIDKYLDDASWNMIDETHPQFELKQLLDYLKLSRSEIPDIGNPTNTSREKLFSEVMRPADSTDNWRNLTPDSLNPSALDGLKIINCRDSREEAMVIASIMRQNLETPEKTTALITEDRNLARRVSNELLRWNIKADDSAGIPLSQTPQGIFLRLIAAVCEQDFAPLPLLSLYKHPLSCFGQSSPQIRTEIRNYEKNFLRNRKERNSNGSDFINTQKEIFAEFYNLISQPQASFKGLLTAHIKLAELIASRPDKSGAEILWSGENGEAAATLITGLIEAADTLGDIPNGQYLELFEAMLAGTMVRSKYGSHPRLRILGPIEARLCTFDCIIISSLNEGTMPANSSSGAWLSRPMKKDFGFPLPEKAIGVLAHDFCEMVCGKEVFLTRAERVDGAPTVKSRWLMRLETVLSAISIDISTLFYKQQLQWIRKLERTENIVPTTAPCPKPPLEARPRELWANDIERLLYDPYTIFASKILRLRKTEDINPDPDAIDIGI